MSSSSVAQSTGFARSLIATGSMLFAAGIAAGSRGAALTSHPSLARAAARCPPMKPEAPVTSTCPFAPAVMSASLGKRGEHERGCEQAKPEAEESGGKGGKPHRGDGEPREQNLQEQHARGDL